MDLLGYAALGGLERLTIVAGAVIIGYWGYRLYTAEKNAGLVFMGLAVVVLVGALATGGSYVRSIGEGYQLASLPAASTEAPARQPGSESPFAEPAEVPEQAPQEAVAAPTPEPAPDASEAPAPMTAEAPAATPEAASPAPAVEAPADAVGDSSPVRIATGQELGGRIVSVKSENVSLEWSRESK